MARPRKTCHVALNPEVDYFKPRGIPLSRLSHMALEMDELEAIRLADLLGFNHTQGGALMGISRATFGRILGRARRKLADALLHGKAIRIERGARYDQSMKG
jgi:predicted DNA-binding protein (UPF0251 family)